MQKTFGQAFGELIREKRGQEGLTQKDLAVKAFDDESKVRRIIELESGSVNRPQIKTMDPLVAYFGITREEIADCRKFTLFSNKEQKEIGLPRELLENLALRFEHESADAPDDELIDFLKFKADELRKLRKRLSELEGDNAALDNKIAAASAALETGQFDEAESILAAAEELQQDQRTLKEIRIQSNIRISRAETALMKGDTPRATEHYEKAADYFSGFVPDEASRILTNAAGTIYEIERRKLKPNLEYAFGLSKKALALVRLDKNRASWVQKKYRLALIQQVLARHDRSQATTYLNDAILNVDEALNEVGTATEEDRFDWASLMVLKGNCYLEKHRRSNQGETHTDLDSALSIFEKIENDLRINARGIHKFHVANNLATAYREKAKLINEKSDGPIVRKARTAYQKAIEYSAQEGLIDEWATANLNFGGLLAEVALKADDEEARFLRIQAIACFSASLEASPQGTFSTNIAWAQFYLGRVLFEFAQTLRPELQEVYLMRSIGSYETAAMNFERNEFPEIWAECHFCIGLSFVIHSRESEDEIAISDLNRALNQFSLARPGFESTGSKNLKKLSSATRHVKELLKSLQPERNSEP